ncbi:MAG: hypothetical protein L3J83_06530 [Proteobacteria bacterium]|nr:hypothetical protein [Pseudomonadota bacterium]
MSAVNFFCTIVTLVVMVLLPSCASRGFHVTGNKFNQSGLLSQSLTITSKKQQQLLVCFSEIQNNAIQGFSCQNDTGFHLFSGGKIANNTFEFEKVSRFLFKIKPQIILNYIKIALLEDYQITDKTIKVKKSIDTTIIIDHKNKLHVAVTQL